METVTHRAFRSICRLLVDLSTRCTKVGEDIWWFLFLILPVLYGYLQLSPVSRAWWYRLMVPATGTGSWSQLLGGWCRKIA